MVQSEKQMSIQPEIKSPHRSAPVFCGQPTPRGDTRHAGSGQNAGRVPSLGVPFLVTKRFKSWIILIPFLVVVMAGAQNFSIDFFTIDGGGGTSSGAEYELTGTIG